jgi:hypothetical protein
MCRSSLEQAERFMASTQWHEARAHLEQAASVTEVHIDKHI